MEGLKNGLNKITLCISSPKGSKIYLIYCYTAVLLILVSTFIAEVVTESLSIYKTFDLSRYVISTLPCYIRFARILKNLCYVKKT